MVPKQIYGLLGWPVSHSLSPGMQMAAFSACGIPAEYKLFPQDPQSVDSFLKTLDNQHISGLNVTIPYKEKALGFVSLDQDNQHLKIIGAINTIAKRQGKWQGFNTDILGFAQHLKEQFDPSGKNIALLGAGGASRAVAYVLAKEKASSISLFDIDRAKANNIASMVQDLFPGFLIKIADSIDSLDIRHQDALINATPCGLKGNDTMIVDAAFLHKGLFVYDLIYNPAQTKLLAAAKARGIACSNGLGMLLYQGMHSFTIWTGIAAPQEIMRDALLGGLYENK